MKHKVDSFNTRAATLKDAEGVSWLLRTVFVETYGAQLDAATLQSHVDVHLSFKALEKDLGCSTFFVTELEAKVLGVLKLRKEPCRAELVKLYLAPEARGFGVGQRLMQKAFTWAKENQLSSLWLKVWKKNIKAVRFYEQQGFYKTGSTAVYVGLTAFDDFVMEVRLDD